MSEVVGEDVILSDGWTGWLREAGQRERGTVLGVSDR